VIPPDAGEPPSAPAPAPRRHVPNLGWIALLVGVGVVLTLVQRFVFTAVEPRFVIQASELELDLELAGRSPIVVETPLLDLLQAVEVVEADAVRRHGERAGEQASPLSASARIVPSGEVGTRHVTLLDARATRDGCAHRLVLTLRGAANGAILAVRQPNAVAGCQPNLELRISDAVLTEPSGGKAPEPVHVSGRWTPSAVLELDLDMQRESEKALFSGNLRLRSMKFQSQEKRELDPSPLASCSVSQGDSLPIFGDELRLERVELGSGPLLRATLGGVAHCGPLSRARVLATGAAYWFSSLLGLLGIGLWKFVREWLPGARGGTP
jgi:hypothetical protein